MSQPEQPAPPESPRRAGVEDRCQQRYPCRPGTIVHLAVRPRFRSFPALVRDVSSCGLGLLLDRPLEIGTMMALQLCGGRPGTSMIRQAQVVHVRRHLPVKNAPWMKRKPLLQSLLSLLTPEAGEEYIWLIGCSLTPPLSPDELRSLC